MKSIKHQIILIIVVLSIAISGTIGLLSYFNARSAIIKEIDDAIHITAKESVKLIASEIKTQLIFLETISQNKSTLDYSNSYKVQYLKGEADRMGYQALAHTDLYGNALRSEGDSTNVADRDYFIQAKEGKPTVSDVVISKVTGEPIIVYAVPVIRESTTGSKITGVLYGVRDANEFSNMISEIVFGESGYAYIINGEGTPIAHSNLDIVTNNEDTIESEDESTDEMVDESTDESSDEIADQSAEQDKGSGELADLQTKMTNGETGTGQYTLDGSKKLVAYAPIPGTDWSLAIAVEMNEVLQQVNRTGNLIIDGNGGLVDSQGNHVLVDLYNPLNLSSANEITIDENGMLACIDENGLNIDIGRILLFDVPDKAMLRSLGDNYFLAEDQESIFALTNDQAGKSRILQGYLESSSVDITKELTDMFITQLAYSINTKSIHAADEMWGMVNQLRR